MKLYKVSRGSVVSVSEKNSWTTITLEEDIILDSKFIANTIPELNETVFRYNKSIYYIKNMDIRLL